MKIFAFPPSDIKKYYALTQTKGNTELDNYLVYFFNKKSRGKNDIFNDYGAKIIRSDPLSMNERDQILDDYINAIGRMSAINGVNREWWATDIASKSRLLSPTQEIINQIALSLRFIDKYRSSGHSICLVGISWPAICCLEEYCKVNNIEIKFNWIFLSRFRSRFSDKLSVFNYFFRGVISSLLSVIKTHIVFGKITGIDKDKPIFLIKSWIFPNSFRTGNNYYDPFCGNLAIDAKKHLEKDVQVVTVSQGFIDKYKCYKKMKNINGGLIFPSESFISIFDIVFASFPVLLYLVVGSIRVPKYIKFMDCNLQPMLRELVKTSGKLIRFSEYLYYYLGRRLALRYKLQGCLMSYEGNHWEKLFILGIRSVSEDTKIIGYYHSAIPQAAAGVFISKYEVLTTPSPDMVITSGIQASKILEKYSFFPGHRIYSACAILYQYLHSHKTILRRGKSKYTVLVMLEGVLDAGLLLEYAINQAINFPYIKFIIRSHPALPFLDLLKHIGKIKLELPVNIVTSENNKVEDDVKECDVGLYWGTATSVEALMIGVPLIWFDRGDVLSYDPLFEFTDFKWTVQFQSPIDSVLDEINNLTDKEYNSGMLKGREYVSQYFTKCNKANISHFF
jgi:hypothetical protein